MRAWEGMTRPRLRPSFREELPVSIPLLTEVLVEALKDEDSVLRGKVSAKSADILVRRSDRHFFSPYLSLAFDERDGKPVMFGRFSPAPGVWSGFLASYALLGTVALFGSIFAFSQWSIGASPTALYAVAIALVLLASSYGSTFIGQNLGMEQMYVMRHFVDRCIERAVEKGALDGESVG